MGNEKTLVVQSMATIDWMINFSQVDQKTI
jgi:hypothetical protein